MLCRMPTVVQYEAPELPVSDGSMHALPPLPQCPSEPDETTVRFGQHHRFGLPMQSC